MLTGLLSWLDDSPARYQGAAVLAFGAAAAAAALAWARSGRLRWLRGRWLFLLLCGLAILAVRWPMIADNEQMMDPDESQLISGALTLAHDGRFWLSVDGTTHGPVCEWALMPFLVGGGHLDYIDARLVSAFLAWAEVAVAVMLFCRLFGEGCGRLLASPLLCAHGFKTGWYNVAMGSEHVPSALLSVGSALVVLAIIDTRERKPWKLVLAGACLCLAFFAKPQSFPIGGFAGVFGMIALSRTAEGAGGRGGALWLACGAIGVVLLFALWIFTEGLAADFWQSFILDNLRYAGGRWFPWSQAPAKWLELVRTVDLAPPFFAGLGFALLGGVTAWPRVGPLRVGLLFSAGLWLASWVSAMAPGRIFPHYLQFNYFPAGLWIGFAGGAVVTALGGLAKPSRVMPGVMAVFLVACVLPQIIGRSRSDGPALGLFRENRGKLMLSQVARVVLAHMTRTEPLGIWGWQPKFWVQTRTWQACRDGNDSREIEWSLGRDFYRERFLADLARSDPPVIVDAIGEGNFAYGDRGSYGNETFPELAALLRERYRLVDDVENCRIYVRKDRP